MENVDKKCCEDGSKGCCQSGSCHGMQSMCGCGHGCHGGKHHLVKIILKLFIVIIIFWCGLKLGEMTGSIRSEYGYGNRSGFGMMRGNNFFTNIPNTNNGTQIPTQVGK